MPRAQIFTGQRSSILIIACGALAAEITELKKCNGWDYMDLQCLDAELHNNPKLIPAKLAEKIDLARLQYNTIFAAYADCGTGGLLDKMLQEKNVQRLPGAHCYEFYSGSEYMKALSEEEPGTFYLTDFLVRHFQRLVIDTLRLTEKPHLREQFFANYKRVVYFSQRNDQELLASAKDIADFLQMDFLHHHTAFGDLETTLRLIDT